MKINYSEIVNSFSSPDISDEEIIALINILADSGEKLCFNSPVYDFASTGGPSSLSTLLVPLYMFSLGVNVINLAVPGRPAGAIDVLSQIPDYRMDIQPGNTSDVEHFYFHLEANDRYAPLDKELFAYRKKENKINVPNLAIASLMAKKIASGAQYIGLDVRVSPFGNFGSGWDECIQNAKRYNHIARQLGKKSTCFLSCSDKPYQRYIGRGEALIALLNIIDNADDSTLQQHNDYCMDMATHLVFNEIKSTHRIDLKRALSENLDFQGSSYDNFVTAVTAVQIQPRHNYLAPISGYIKYNLESIRSYLVKRQQQAESISKYPDPCGMILLKNQGEYVLKDEPILLIRNSIPEIEKMYSFCTILNEEVPIDYRKEVI